MWRYLQNYVKCGKKEVPRWKVLHAGPFEEADLQEQNLPSGDEMLVALGWRATLVTCWLFHLHGAGLPDPAAR